MGRYKGISCTNFRELSDAGSDAAVRLFRAMANPVPCAPVRLALDDMRNPLPDPVVEREMVSGVCGRCGNRHQWPSYGGSSKRLYCDGCKRY